MSDREGGDVPEVSVIMPVRNEAGALGATIASLRAQQFDGSFEVIVADGRSVDRTREILEQHAAEDPRIRVVDNADGRIPHGLNAALAHARGHYLVRVDGHARVQPDFLQRLIDHLRGGRADAAGGVICAVGQSRFGRAVALANDSPYGVGNAKHHYADEPSFVDHVAFPAYLTERVRVLGGWDEQFTKNQDFEFNHRYRLAGGRILLDPAVKSDWLIQEDVRGLARQYGRYGYWRCRSLAKHPSSFRSRWLAPPLLITTLATGIAASPSKRGRVLLGLSGSSYLLFLAVTANKLAGKAAASSREPSSRGHIALAVATMQLSWGSGFVTSALTLAARRLLPTRPR